VLRVAVAARELAVEVAFDPAAAAELVGTDDAARHVAQTLVLLARARALAAQIVEIGAETAPFQALAQRRVADLADQRAEHRQAAFVAETHALVGVLDLEAAEAVGVAREEVHRGVARAGARPIAADCRGP
jgi:hypothetical protein